MRAPKLLYLVSEDWYFCSHRLPIARAARVAGYEVVVVTRVGEMADTIRAAGIRVISLEMRRGGIDPLRDLVMVRELVRIYSAERPDIVHHVAMKPLVYGTLAARLCEVPAVLNAVAGMGFVFASHGARARWLRPALRFALGRALRYPDSTSIVQNPDDQALLTKMGVAPARIRMIRGSGVDLERFHPTPEPMEAPGIRVALVSRLLWDKGVAELVEAARRLRERRPDIRVVLIGAPDDDNPACVPVAQIEDWVREGIVEWSGATQDVPGVWAGTHVAVLPSYREGLPKTLLEAAACGRPIIATDVPGCREIVHHGLNGLLVPARSPEALADAMLTLAGDPALRARMGAEGRALVEREFSVERVIHDTLALYADVTSATG